MNYFTDANYDYITGTRYGYICSNDMDDEIVYKLMFDCVVNDMSYDSYIEECRLRHESEQETLQDDAEYNGSCYQWEDFDEQQCADEYKEYEPTKEIEYQGVKLISSWLCGALHFYVIDSPHKVTVSECSPCIPGAGNLRLNDVLSSDVHFDASNKTYSIPVDWFREFDTEAYEKGKQAAKDDGGKRFELACMQLENYEIAVIERCYWFGYCE